MKKLKSGILLTAITTLLAFMSVLYISSCNNKAPSLSPTSCENVVCQHGGYCNQGVCLCPTGYQDSRCGTKWNSKFVGRWNVVETVTSSDTYDTIGAQRYYQVVIDTTAVPKEIFISGLRGNGTYTDVTGLIDSTTIGFQIQAYIPGNNGNFTIVGGYAQITKIKNTADTASGIYYTDYLNAQSIREHDTIKFIMTK